MKSGTPGGGRPEAGPASPRGPASPGPGPGPGPAGDPADSRDARHRLLARAIEYLSRRGVSGVSLRELAVALGTSHRMLIYHFGSKEGLLVEVVRAIESQQREWLATLCDPGGESPADASLRLWRRVSDPALAPYGRLFFEMYGQALQGHSYALPLLEGVIEDWLTPLTELLRRAGRPPGAARAEARLGLAVARGLMLDLLTTGDAAGVEEAFRLYLTGRAGAA